ncbi:MAG: HEAT repeat domain-containing protein [Candidatus Lokiarchaeia archaeon]
MGFRGSEEDSWKSFEEEMVELEERLGKMKRENDVEGLINVLKHDDDWNARIRAAEVLAEIKDKRAVEPLIQALRDAIWRVQEAAGAALIRIMGLGALDPLIEALRDENVETQVSAAMSLSLMAKGSAGKRDPFQMAFKGYAVQMGGAVEPLIQALKDEDDAVREAAAIALGFIGDERAVEPLTHLLEDEVDSVIMAAKEALSDIEGKKHSK